MVLVFVSTNYGFLLCVKTSVKYTDKSRSRHFSCLKLTKSLVSKKLLVVISKHEYKEFISKTLIYNSVGTKITNILKVCTLVCLIKI